MKRSQLIARQKAGLERKLTDSLRYLRVIERLLAEHPEDAFLTRQFEQQQKVITEIREALTHVEKMK